jgi:2,5-dioxopentanoate dehydrogenase
MFLQPVLIDGAWRESEEPAGRFHSVDPSTRAPSSEHYPVSGAGEVERACQAAFTAAAALRTAPPERIAAFLDDYASRIEVEAGALVDVAARETGLPASPRLRSVELPRAVSQIR